MGTNPVVCVCVSTGLIWSGKFAAVDWIYGGTIYKIE